jgi:hypothetical protein
MQSAAGVISAPILPAADEFTQLIDAVRNGPPNSDGPQLAVLRQ